MESNSVCNQTSDKKKRTTAKRESDLLITITLTNSELYDTKSYYQLNMSIRGCEKRVKSTVEER